MADINLKGMGVALITPFKEDESVDYEALGKLVDYQVQNGTDYLVVLGTTAETPTLTEEEKKNVLEKLDKCGGKRAVIINIMLDHNMQITSSDNGRIIEIPYLYRLDRKEIGTEIIAKINREGYLQ